MDGIDTGTMRKRYEIWRNSCTREQAHVHIDIYTLCDALDVCRKERDEFRERLEQLQVQLAGCGLCGELGADKYAAPEHWPGEQKPDGPLVHSSCEQAERKRAFNALTTRQREETLDCIRRRM